MAAALGRLTDEDRARGRNVRASTKARIAALAAGDRCRTDLAASEKHFASFETAIAAAETSPSPATIKAAADATALLDGFDRSRSRYAGEAGLLVKGKEFAGLVASTLATYAHPIIGALPVQAVDTGLVLKVLEPIWTMKPETASRVRGRLESILDFAKVRGYRDGENPARWRGHLDKLLPAHSKVRQVEHHAALPYAELPAFLASLRELARIIRRMPADVA
jgi:hypothetical protein